VLVEAYYKQEVKIKGKTEICPKDFPEAALRL
jgi:hypothetical protein